MKDKLEQIVINIQASGDRSVGMFPISLKVTIEGLDMKRDIEDACENGRKEFRTAIEKFFAEWLDYGRVGASFSDECIDCGEVFSEKKRGAGYIKHKCVLNQY